MRQAGPYILAPCLSSERVWLIFNPDPLVYARGVLIGIDSNDQQTITEFKLRVANLLEIPDQFHHVLFHNPGEIQPDPLLMGATTFTILDETLSYELLTKVLFNEPMSLTDCQEDELCYLETHRVHCLTTMYLNENHAIKVSGFEEFCLNRRNSIITGDQEQLCYNNFIAYLKLQKHHSPKLIFSFMHTLEQSNVYSKKTIARAFWAVHRGENALCLKMKKLFPAYDVQFPTPALIDTTIFPKLLISPIVQDRKGEQLFADIFEKLIYVKTFTSKRYQVFSESLNLKSIFDDLKNIKGENELLKLIALVHKSVERAVNLRLINISAAFFPLYTKLSLRYLILGGQLSKQQGALFLADLLSSVDGYTEEYAKDVLEILKAKHAHYFSGLFKLDRNTVLALSNAFKPVFSYYPQLFKTQLVADNFLCDELAWHKPLQHQRSVLHACLEHYEPVDKLLLKETISFFNQIVAFRRQFNPDAIGSFQNFSIHCDAIRTLLSKYKSHGEQYLPFLKQSLIHINVDQLDRDIREDCRELFAHPLELASLKKVRAHDLMRYARYIHWILHTSVFSLSSLREITLKRIAKMYLRDVFVSATFEDIEDAIINVSFYWQYRNTPKQNLVLRLENGCQALPFLLLDNERIALFKACIEQFEFRQLLLMTPFMIEVYHNKVSSDPTALLIRKFAIGEGVISFLIKEITSVGSKQGQTIFKAWLSIFQYRIDQLSGQEKTIPRSLLDSIHHCNLQLGVLEDEKLRLDFTRVNPLMIEISADYRIATLLFLLEQTEPNASHLRYGDLCFYALVAFVDPYLSSRDRINENVQDPFYGLVHQAIQMTEKVTDLTTSVMSNAARFYFKLYQTSRRDYQGMSQHYDSNVYLKYETIVFHHLFFKPEFKKSFDKHNPTYQAIRLMRDE